MSAGALASGERLEAALSRHRDLAIAVSGGVDSMTLATVAHRRGGAAPLMIHAVSPAVPKRASALVRDYAARHGWRLRLLDAGEMADADYRANPVNRCYFCKSNLYGRMRETTEATLASGTNLDDLQDFRPGLQAADERGVVHPFVEARMTKAEIRSMARDLGLYDLAELPAQPCLASRVETGIGIDPEDLRFIDRVESRLAARLPPDAVLRCRVTRTGVVLELGETQADLHPALEEEMRQACAASGRVFSGVRPYRRGAAFLRADA